MNNLSNQMIPIIKPVKRNSLIVRLMPIKRETTEPNSAKIYPSSPFTMNFDGCSKGNPGFAGIGAVIYKNEEEIWSGSKFIGVKTNNFSEYSALIFGLKQAIQMGIEHLCVLGDSLLVINQVNGVYKVKSEDLKELYEEVNQLKKQFKIVEFNHVYREKNKRADELSNIALEEPPNIDEQIDKITELQKKIVTISEDIKIMETEWIEEEKLDEMMMKRPSKRLASLTETTINSFFPVISVSKSKVLNKT